MGDFFSIGEASSRVGLPTSTLRYYDRIGLVPATGRSGGKRRYDHRAVQRIRAVVLCQRAGFRLEEIASLLDAAPPWQGLARAKLQELNSKIDELQETVELLQSALDCGCRRLDTCGRVADLSDLGVHRRR